MAERFVIILNPKAGNYHRRRFEKALQQLRNAGIDVDIRPSARIGHSRDLAAAAVSEAPDAVVAAGGDGTINEVVNGLAGAPVPMGILPVGSANVLASELGVPRNIDKAVQVLLDRHVVPVYTGLAEGRRFVLMAGMGFDADVVQRLSLGLKSRIGRMAYLVAGLACAAGYRRCGTFSIEVDGRPFKGASVVICNARSYAGPFILAPDADLRKPEFQVCIFKGRRMVDILRYAGGIAGQRHHLLPDVELVTGKVVTVASDSMPRWVQADGDIIGQVPITVRASEERLNLIVPGERF